MTREDVLAVKAYLDTVPTVRKTNHPLEMEWPFRYRFLQLGWRLMYFDFEEQGFQHDLSKSAEWNRGAFIVEGPGHCAMCHTQLNYFGVPEKEYYLAGAFIDGYYAPDISARGLRDLNDRAVANIFKQDETPEDTPLAGPMADVEHNSLRYLRYDDMLAVGEYLKSVKSESPPVEGIGPKELDEKAGQALFESTCKVCHLIAPVGAPKVNDRFAWEVLLDQGKDHLYQVAIKGSGGMPPKGGCQQCSEARLKAAVDYMIKLAMQARFQQTQTKKQQ
jgi:cytochrome c5